MSPVSDERFEELCAGYVLSALEDAERARFLQELHRRGDEGLGTLARMEEVIGHLALAAEPAAPPPELRERLFADLGIEVGPEAAAPTSTSRTPERPARTEERPPRAEERPREHDGDRPRRAGVWMAAAAVFLAVAAALGVWALQVAEQLDRRETALAEARTELAAMDSLRARLDAARANFGSLASPATRAHSLSGTESRPAASARIYIDPRTGRALILGEELAILPPDSVYQLWAIRGQTPASVGTFQVDDLGSARIPVPDPAVLRQADALAVTVEPAPGRPRPSGEIILSSSL